MSKQQNQEDKARWRALAWQFMGLAMTKAPKAVQLRSLADALTAEAEVLYNRASSLELDR
jgi:hypothetical protein